MFTDNKDFYPTPQNLIDKMLDGLDWKMIHTVLEPSAGKGNIVEALKKKEDFNNRWYTTIKLNIDCIENDVNLRAVLKEKNFRVVHDDFLTYDTMKEYDLIIMNPPFSNGCKHLLKALEMQQRNGGAVICLLNAETLKNKCNNERIMLNRMLTEVKAIGRELGLPSELVDKIPTDGLCGKTDEDNLGFTYAELDEYIRDGIEPSEEVKAKIDSMHEKNLFKLQPMPSFVYQA